VEPARTPAQRASNFRRSFDDLSVGASIAYNATQDVDLGMAAEGHMKHAVNHLLVGKHCEAVWHLSFVVVLCAALGERCLISRAYTGPSLVTSITDHFQQVFK
jgi:hypothetical protein